MNEKELGILKDLQRTELDLLTQFIEVCNKLNLNYFLCGGTLIGAVRHKGFIPWDDDIDVCMLRKDYDIFINEAQKYLDDKYFLQTYETDEDYLQCFAKIRNSETTFLEKSVKNFKMNHGVFIDIFPIDNYYLFNKLKVSMLKYALYSKYFENNKKNVLKKFLLFISKKLYGRKNKKELCREIEKVYSKAKNRKSKMVVNFCGFYCIKKEKHYKKDYQKCITTSFENIKANIPFGYDRILRKTYGNYMKLPPEEKRVSHHFSEIIDVNKSYNEYVQNNFDR